MGACKFLYNTGRGPVDFALMVGDLIICVTEVKREGSLEQGMAQNIAQLDAALVSHVMSLSVDLCYQFVVISKFLFISVYLVQLFFFCFFIVVGRWRPRRV